MLLYHLSDHLPIFYIRHDKIKKSSFGYLSARKINDTTTQAFKNLLETAPWEIVAKENRPNHAYSTFFENLDGAYELAFPIVDIKINKRNFPFNPWMTPGLLRSRKQKEKLGAKKLKKPTAYNKENFQTYNSIYNKVIRQAKKKFYETRFKEICRDIKKTWDTVREALGTKKIKSGIPPYLRIGNNTLNDDKSVADGFNDFFSSIGSELANKITATRRHFTEFLGERVTSNFTFARVTPDLIREVAAQLKPKRSCGPDNISSKLLKDILPIIINILCHLFNLSFSNRLYSIKI